MHDEADNAQPRREGETQDQLVAEYRSLTRGLAQDLGTIALATGVGGFAYTTGKFAAEGTAAKVKDVLTSKDEPSQVELPPGVEN